MGGKGEEDYNRRIQQFSQLISQISQIDSSKFDELDRLNFEIFERYISNELKHLEYRNYRMPISKVNGFHLYFPKLYLFVPLNTI